MAEFKFNFDLEESKREEGDAELATPAPSFSRPEQLPPGKRVLVCDFHKNIAARATPLSYTVPYTNVRLKYLTAGNVHSTVGNLQGTVGCCEEHGEIGTKAVGDFEDLVVLSNSHSTDLIPGVYEGGMVTWECAFDLVCYLSEIKFDFSGINVLELGCGTGLPSIYALIKGARSVSLQDYNHEVINYITIPSLLVNITDQENGGCKEQDHQTKPVSQDSRLFFYSSSWDGLDKLFHSESLHSNCPPPVTFDLILTSETIYSESSQPSLLSAMKSLLSPLGSVLVAAKSYYFGVGGSCANFEQLVKSDGYFSFEKCKIIDSSVPRVIARLKHL